MDPFAGTGAGIESEFASGEQLLWSGKPRQGVFLRASDLIAIPFSLMWGGFAIFWEVAALTSVGRVKPGAAPPGFAFIFPLFGVPFVAIGLYLIAGRFFVDERQRAKTTYAVTNQRVIIRSGLFSSATKSLNLRTLTDLSITEGADGRGTISFGPTLPGRMTFAGAWPGSDRYAPPCFDSIEEARRVYAIIRAAQAKT